MIKRRQLPVASPISARALLRASLAIAGGPGNARNVVTSEIRARYNAKSVTLTDSGTSALAFALLAVARPGGRVAMPAYACVDLIAAALYAAVEVRLYDVQPSTLNPDLDSLRAVVAEGVDAVLVAHLYGMPVDVAAVRDALNGLGVPIIEDAAQNASATVNGARAGALGDVSILSFGRGKGTTSGNGGALLSLSPEWTSPIEQLSGFIAPKTRGTKEVFGAAASWLMGRPWLYDVPSRIPALHLGETVYHDAETPASMSDAALVLLQSALASSDANAALRREHAAELTEQISRSDGGVQACKAVPGALPGYLRLPVLAPRRAPAPQLGVMRGYPRPLSAQPELQPILHPSPSTFPGATELAETLMTLPTHHLMTRHDLDELGAWLRSE